MGLKGRAKKEDEIMAQKNASRATGYQDSGAHIYGEVCWRTVPPNPRENRNEPTVKRQTDGDDTEGGKGGLTRSTPVRESSRSNGA